MAELHACRVCLATDIKLFDMYRNRLVSAYENLTGTKIMSSDGFPQQMCSCCSILLLKYVAFKDKCHSSQELLSYLMGREEITTEYLRQMDHSVQLSLTTTIPQTVNYPEHIKEEDTTDNEFPDTDYKDIDDIKCETYSDEEPLSKKVKKSKKRFKKEVQSDFDVLPNIENVDSDIDVIVLDKQQQIEEIQLRKESQNYLKSCYKCDHCFKGFMTEATFKNHMVRHDPETGTHCCEICETRWPNHRTLRAHQATSHERKYICKLCNHVSKSSYRAKEHSQWHNGYTFICKICGATFAKSTSHLTHVRLHHPSKHCCELCGESFIGQNGLNMHKKKAHRDAKDTRGDLYLCTICGAQFNNAEAHQRHVAMAENDVCDTSLRPCVQCGDSFTNEDLLKEHLKSHSKEEPAKCDEVHSARDKCAQVPARQCTAGAGDAAPPHHYCAKCNRTFATERSYAIHYQRAHLGLRPIKKDGYKRDRSGSRVVCEICGKECLSKANLVYHQRTHTGEKPYQCTDCPKRFSVYQRLQIHRRTHTGESPYKCSHCPKAFKHKAALNRHDRVHTGAKPYTCGHCGKSFSQSNSMKLHVRTVHLKMPAPYRNPRGKQGEEPLVFVNATL